MDLKSDFNTYWNLIRPDAVFQNRREAAEQEWLKHPEKHKAIIRWLRKHGAYSGRNPYFFIQDFQVIGTQADEDKEPTNYNGGHLPDIPLVSACYKGKFGIYSAEEAEAFGMSDVKPF